MNNALDSKAVAYGMVAIIGIVAVYYIVKKLGSAAVSAVGSAASAVGTAVNPVSDQNLAYRGVNAVGASVSGDSSFSLGSWIYDLVHPAYDPNAVTPDANTPNTGGSTIATSPVTPSPAVLPYSYKQAVIDTPAILGTDALLTPNLYGSSGSWAESGVPGTAFGPSSPDYTAITPQLAAGQYPSLLLQ